MAGELVRAVVVRGSAPLDVVRSYPERPIGRGRRGLLHDANMGSRSTARACPVQRPGGPPRRYD
jgi:hypothetical protein